jgi:hypothetical protein
VYTKITLWQAVERAIGYGTSLLKAWIYASFNTSSIAIAGVFTTASV